MNKYLHQLSNSLTKDASHRAEQRVTNLRQRLADRYVGHIPSSNNLLENCLIHGERERENSIELWKL